MLMDYLMCVVWVYLTCKNILKERVHSVHVLLCATLLRCAPEYRSCDGVRTQQS